MISIYYNASDPYRINGFDHFIKKYGLTIKKSIHSTICMDIEAENNNKLILFIKVSNNNIQNDICGYLTKDTIEAPLFEKPSRLEVGESFAMFSLDGKQYPCITVKDNIITVSFDIFNEIGRILSGHLEQFWKSGTHEYRKIARSPIVDIYEKILFDCIMEACKKLEISLAYKPFWPEGKKFALCLTHDVDRTKKTYQYFSHSIKKTIKGKFCAPLKQFKSLVEKFKGYEPYWLFEKIMDVETRSGVKSTFFFLNENGTLNVFDFKSWKLYSGRYSLFDPKIVNIMKKLHQNGWEIGVHGSYNSYSNGERIKEEKRILESLLDKDVSGIRQHYCNMIIPDTWTFQEKAGFRYDTGLCMKNEPGFRWGTCFPFFPFNIEINNKLNILEIPLLIMDNALFNKEDPLRECRKIVEIVEECGGVLVVLWHPNVFSENDYPGMAGIYEELIGLCKERGAWVATASEIEQWWKSR